MGCNNANPSKCFACNASNGRPKAERTSDAQFFATSGVSYRSAQITAWRKAKARKAHAIIKWELAYDKPQ